MAQLRLDEAKITSRDTVIIVAGPDPAKDFKNFWVENDLHFIGIPDPRHLILKLFGQEVNLFRLGRMPAQVIVDKKGIVRLAYYGHAMSDIPENDEIFSILDQINREGI
jgi:peroxiredoxin